MPISCNNTNSSSNGNEKPESFTSAKEITFVVLWRETVIPKSQVLPFLKVNLSTWSCRVFYFCSTISHLMVLVIAAVNESLEMVTITCNINITP